MAHHDYYIGHTDPIPNGHVPDGPTEYTLLWDQLVASINGDDGGTWAPSAFITVGGSGFNLTGTGHTVAASARLSVASTGEIKLLSGGLFNAASGSTVTQAGAWNLTSTGVATCASGSNFIGSAGSFAQWSGGWTFVGTVTYNGTTVTAFNASSVTNYNNGSSLQLKGTVDITSTGVLTAKSGASIVGESGASATWSTAWTFGGVTTFNASSSISGNSSATASWGGTWTSSNVVTYSGPNAYQSLRTNTGSNSTTTINLWEQDVLIVPDITGDRVWTCAHPLSDRVVRCTVEWPSSSTNHSLELKDGATSLITVDSSSSAVDLCSIVLVYNGTKWFVESERHKPRVWLATYGSDGDISVPAGDYDVVTIYHLTLDRTWTFDAPTNDEVRQVLIRWPAQAETPTLTLKTGADTFGTLTATAAASGVNALAVYDGNKWYLAGRY